MEGESIFGLGSLCSMVRSFQARLLHFIVRSFHSFSIKTVFEVLFLASWLKEQGIHVINALVSTRGLKTHENF